MAKKESMGTVLGMPTPSIVEDVPPKGIKRRTNKGTLLMIPIRDDQGGENSRRVVNRGGRSVVVDDDETLKVMNEERKEERPSDPDLRLIGFPSPDLDKVELSDDIEEKSEEIDERELYIPGRRKKKILGVFLILLFIFLVSYLFYYMVTMGQ